jgi:hypothetical protein
MISERPAVKPRRVNVSLPWYPDGEIAANIAIAGLRDSLMAWMTTRRGVHVETLMAAVGALAGFAAQCAAWDEVRRSKRPIPKERLALAATASGERYYFGDLINGYLVPEGARGWTLWGFVAAAAVEAGLPESELPNYTDMFRHVAETVGSRDFGIPQVPEAHQPRLLPRTALEMYWSGMRAILELADGPGPGQRKGVAVAHWPAILGLVARQFVLVNKDKLSPEISLRLVMESAIMMSKVDPATVPTMVATAARG